MCYHVLQDCGAWFLGVIMSCLHSLCCLPSVTKQKHDFHFFSLMYNKTIYLILDLVFVINRIIKVVVRFISRTRRLQCTSTTIIMDIIKKPHPIIVYLKTIIVFRWCIIHWYHLSIKGSRNLFPFRRKMERNILLTLCHVSWFFVIEITRETYTITMLNLRLNIA